MQPAVQLQYVEDVYKRQGEIRVRCAEAERGFLAGVKEMVKMRAEMGVMPWGMKVPYKGYRRIELLEWLQYTWLVRICESGKEIEVYEDEFETD